MAAGTLVVLGTGGTIAGLAGSADDHLGYRAAQLGVQELAESIPALRGRTWITEQVAQIDSKDMTADIWRSLALRAAHWLARPEVRGLVITHGTDTVEETAYFLQAVLAPRKPVVLACAMRPASALAPDGPQNLADAVVVCEAPGACGTSMVCAGAVHGAVDVRKVHTYRLDAFSSGDAGPIGYVEAGQLRQVRGWPSCDPQRARELMDRLQRADLAWPRVQIVTSHAGADGTVVEALLASGVDGLVVAGTGNGSVHQALEAALVRASAQGIRILRSTRCAAGEVLPHDGDPLPSTRLSPVKARIQLMLDLLA